MYVKDVSPMKSLVRWLIWWALWAQVPSLSVIPLFGCHGVIMVGSAQYKLCQKEVDCGHLVSSIWAQMKVHAKGHMLSSAIWAQLHGLSKFKCLGFFQVHMSVDMETWEERRPLPFLCLPLVGMCSEVRGYIKMGVWASRIFQLEIGVKSDGDPMCPFYCSLLEYLKAGTHCWNHMTAGHWSTTWV